MSDLSRRFQNSLASSGIIPVGSRVLVAVSGGADSVALLCLLKAAAGPFSLHLEAAHLDHALRPESTEDAAFVTGLCDQLDIPLVVERRDIADKARLVKGNLEEVGRLERRDFLQAAARARHCSLIALGHHRDDQVETFLLRLLRGTGPTGLAGMRGMSGDFVRPLLDFCRADILAYLQDRELPWREDESNADRSLTRNRIRHELLPLLRDFNPKIEHRLADLCTLFAYDETYWAALTEPLLAENGRKDESCFSLPRQLLLEAPPALSGRLIRASLHEVRGDLRRITRTHIAAIQRLASGETPQAELNLPDCWVGRRYEWLWFRPSPPRFTPPPETVITGPGVFPLPDGRRLVVAVHNRSQGDEGGEVVELSADEVSFPLLLRTVREGDRICPAGMQGSKKLKDLFIDAKLTKEERAVQPLVVRDDEILWVVGLRRCRQHRLRCAAQEVVRLSVLSAGTDAAADGER